MINIEQIKTLDNKVKKAVELIDELKSENSTLKGKLASYQKRIEELEKLIEDFKRDQGEIEQGIVDAIKQLDSLEGSASPRVGDEQSQTQRDPVSAPSPVQEVLEDKEPAERPASEETPDEEDPETEAHMSLESSGENTQTESESEEEDDSDSSELDIF